MAVRGIEKIVVGVDGSEQSAAALGWAIRMAQGMGSEVITVFGIDIPIWFAESYVTIPPPPFDPEWRREMQQAFEERWCKPLKDAGVKFRTIMEDGRPRGRDQVRRPESAAAGSGAAQPLGHHQLGWQRDPHHLGVGAASDPLSHHRRRARNRAAGVSADPAGPERAVGASTRTAGEGRGPGPPPSGRRSRCQGLRRLRGRTGEGARRSGSLQA
jgi:hypothetical protein